MIDKRNVSDALLLSFPFAPSGFWASSPLLKSLILILLLFSFRSLPFLQSWDPVAAFKPVIAAAQAHGSLVIGQLTQGGRQVSEDVNPHPVSSSDIQNPPSMGMVLSAIFSHRIRDTSPSQLIFVVFFLLSSPNLVR